MNEIDIRLKLAKDGLPQFQPKQELHFAWRKVTLMNGTTRRFCWVLRFMPLNLWWEYYDLGPNWWNYYSVPDTLIARIYPPPRNVRRAWLALDQERIDGC